MGSFIAEGKKPKPEMKREPSSVPPPQMPGFGAASASSPPSQGTSSESDDDDTGSPAMNLSGNLGAYNNSSHHNQTMPSYSSVGGWSNSGNHQPRHDSDIRTMPR